MKLRAFRSVTAVVALVMAVAGCSNASSTGSASKPRGGTVIIGSPNDASTTNPVLSSDYPDSSIGCQIYEGLVTPRLDGKSDPLLAKSWTVAPDGLTYTFSLVTTNWTDGQPFTSADVKFTLTTLAPQYSAFFGRVSSSINSIETPDEHTVVIKLAKPYGPFLEALGCNQGAAVLPMHLFQGTDISTNPASLTKPVGTGPFMMSEWTPGDHITLVKNPHYWMTGQPYIDRVIYQIIPNASSQILALQSGGIQYLSNDNIAQSDYSAIKANPKLEMHEDMFPASDDLLFFNVRGNRPTSHVEVRQALAQAIDRNFLLKALYAGTGSVGTEPIDNRIPWAVDPKVDYNKMYPFDANAAKAKLDAAGFKVGANGTRFTLDYVVSASHPPYVAAGEAMQTMFQAIGVKLNLVTLDDQATGQRVFKDGNFDISIQGYTTNNDPALGVVREFTTSNIGKNFANASGYSNPQVDQLADLGQNQATNAERAKYYNQMQEIIAKDLPVFLILQRTSFDASSKRLQGLWNGHIGYGDWWVATIQPA